MSADSAKPRSVGYRAETDVRCDAETGRRLLNNLDKRGVVERQPLGDASVVVRLRVRNGWRSTWAGGRKRAQP